MESLEASNLASLLNLDEYVPKDIVENVKFVNGKWENLFILDRVYPS